MKKNPIDIAMTMANRVEKRVGKKTVIPTIEQNGRVLSFMMYGYPVSVSFGVNDQYTAEDLQKFEDRLVAIFTLP